MTARTGGSRSTSSPDVAIVGGGIAGLSLAAWLGARGAKARLLEREPWLWGHASGRNAAIFRPLELEETTLALATRSLALLRALGAAPLDPTGLLLASASPEPAAELLERGLERGLGCELVTGTALGKLAPILRGGEVTSAIHVPSGGVLDAHAMQTALVEHARTQGATLELGASVTRVVVESGRALGVELADGTLLPSAAVVLASGAFSAGLGEAAGAPLPLRPLRRHLVQLETNTLPKGAPVVWRLDESSQASPSETTEVYFRPESGGVLASPCDQVLAPAGVPAADPRACELLAHKLGRTAPALSHARVKASWACLRTFAPDRELVVGEDPRVTGLYWLTGFGGRGMTVGAAAAERLADALTGAAPAELHAFAPARLLDTA